VVVVGGSEVKGIVTDRKIVTGVIAEGRNPAMERIGDVVDRRVIACSEDSDLDQALKTLSDNKIRRCPVVNRKKELVGILSISDLGREMKTRMDALFNEVSKSSTYEMEHERSRPGHR
jgi:CBS domain-containing protein